MRRGFSRRSWAGVFGLLALTGCADTSAPTARGVCWRAAGSSADPRFAPLASNVGSLDDCAAQLEALHLEGAAEVLGAFQGYFIFVDSRQVSSATAVDGFRYPIFQPGQRKEIDADLRGLIQDRNGRPPDAGEISVQRR